MRRVALIGLVVAAAAASAALAYAAQTPRQLADAIIAAGKSQKSVHYVDRSPQNGSAYVGDVAASSGKVRFNWGTYGQVSVLFAHGVVYEKGNVGGLQIEPGLTVKQSQKYAGQWIRIAKGQKGYSFATGWLTLGPYVSNLRVPSGAKLSTFKAVINGTPVIGVAATNAQQGYSLRLAAPARGKPLPLDQTSRQAGCSGSAIACVFRHSVLSKWNESVTVTAPASSVPIATVLGS